MRAIVISPLDLGPRGFSTLGDSPFLKMIPSALLYWDKFAIPVAIPGMLPALESNLDFLIREGAAESWFMKRQNSMVASNIPGLIASLRQGFEQRLKREGETWSLVSAPGFEGDFSHILDAIGMGGGERKQRQVLELALVDALPAPPYNTPYADILLFKEQRRDHFELLHLAIERLAASLAGVQELDDAVRIGREQIGEALSELDRVLYERWSNRLLNTLRAAFGEIVVGAGAGLAAAQQVSLPIAVSTVAGAVGFPLIKAAVNSIVAPAAVPHRLQPFVYAVHAQHQFRR